VAAGVALGFGLGGFFDGILLHQVLQWHHLLSGLEEVRGDLRFLILTDGLFHVLMYLVTGAGLWLLWRRRQSLVGARLWPDVLIGFATWHIVDAVLSHWVLGIHRVRMDVENPLVWDLLWLCIFGAVPLALGIALTRRPQTEQSLRLSPLSLAVGAILAGAGAAIPPPSQDVVMVLFRPGLTADEMANALAAVDGRVLWTDPSDQLWAMQLPKEASLLLLYQHGALLVGSSILPAGCFNWIKA
jgi:uncharacterized membrane protein